MKFTIIALLSVTTILCISAIGYALPGPVSYGAIAEYDYQTGQIVLSYDSVSSWNIISDSSGLTGEEPAGLPSLEFGVIINSDSNIGEGSFVRGNATNLELGNVAEPGLPLNDLTLFWHHPSDPFGSAPVTYINVPEPRAIALAIVAALFYLGSPRRY